jgi:hypothetical protein
MTSLTKIRIICTITGVVEADSPAASFHPDSLKPVTKGRKFCINHRTLDLNRKFILIYNFPRNKQLTA